MSRIKPAISALLLLCLTATATAAGSVQWLQVVQQVGEIRESEGKISRQYQMVNTGDEEVTISYARGTCGCSSVQYPRHPIQPGDTATITATFNPAGRPGEFTMYFTVLCNAEPHRTDLVMTGRVIADPATVDEKYPVAVGSLRLDAASVPLGEITAGGVEGAEIAVYNDSDVDMRLSASDMPPWLRIIPEQATVPPGNVYRMVVGIDTDLCPSRGYVEGAFTLFARPVRRDTRAMAGIRDIAVMAVIYDDFASWTDRQHADAPALRPDADRLAMPDIGQPTTLPLTLANAGTDTLRIYGVHPTERCITATPATAKIAGGESATISVTIDPGKMKEPLLNTHVIIYSNDPRQPKKLIRIAATKQ